MQQDDKQLATREEVGTLGVRKDVLSDEQQHVFKRVVAIVDKTPSLDWRRDEQGHNQDFCLIAGKIEPVKNFCLKVQYVAGLSIATVGEETKEIPGEDIGHTVTVAVWKEGDGRKIVMAGGSTHRECGGSRNKRVFHDAHARAQTRAFKTALEAYMGFPFINLMVERLFGGFGVDGADDPADHGVPPARNVTERAVEKVLTNEVWRAAKGLAGRGVLDDDELAEYRTRIKANNTDRVALEAIRAELQSVASARTA